MNRPTIIQKIKADFKAAPTRTPVIPSGLTDFVKTELDKAGMFTVTIHCQGKDFNTIAESPALRYTIAEAAESCMDFVIIFDEYDEMASDGAMLLISCKIRSFGGIKLTNNVRFMLTRKEEPYASIVDNDPAYYTVYSGITALTSENIDHVFKACLTDDTEHALITEGVVSTFAFDKARLHEYEEAISDMLLELPAEFMATSGTGGASFLRACLDCYNVQWTGVHAYMERLFALGCATGKTRLLMPKDLWKLFPGGMPYYIINDLEIGEEIES